LLAITSRQDIENQLEFVRELVRRLNDRGVPVLAGTDSGVEGLFPGKALHRELGELVTAGLSPADALRTATSTPGRFLAEHVLRSPELGRIEEGFAADLILLDADPMLEIDNVSQLRGTMSRGMWHPLEAMERARAGMRSDR
jgi:imidazolonepropionase-like amidohydrolase